MYQRLKISSITFGMGLVLTLTNCSSDAVVKGTMVTHNDFESVLGWGGINDPSITTEQSHSGKYAVKVGPDNDYGYTYSRALGQISPARIKTLTVSAWVWVSSAQSLGSLVVDIRHSPERDTPVFYAATPLAKESGKFKRWQQITKTFSLPDSVQAINQIKCYMWREGSTESLYLDDFTLSVEN